MQPSVSEEKPEAERLGLMSIMAIVVGGLAALLVLAFRWLIEASQGLFLQGGGVGNYESLPLGWRFALPVMGALILAAVFSRLSPQSRQVGIPHVLGQIKEPGTVRLPIINAVVQFFAGSLAIVTGHSVDREGPGVHLGAAVGNVLSTRWRMTNEEIYTLTLAGAGAAIASAFNTPLAGVVFVLEVFRARYAFSRFMVIILACVVAAVVGRAFYGDAPAFQVPKLALVNDSELLLVLVLGVAVGLLAASMIAGATWTARHTRSWSPWRAFTSAGVLTGLLGIWVPQILGVSYDTLGALMLGQLGMETLLILVAAKLLATTVSVGLGIPGGMIGPSLVVGGAMGAVLGYLMPDLLGVAPVSVAFYAVVGMIAMMSATLKAPLAALIALLELTGNPHLILPGMLAVVAADAVVSILLGQDSMFERLSNVRKSRTLN